MAISLYATAGVAQVTGGLITGKYGQDQVYDVQRAPANPITGNSFTVSSFARPFKDTGPPRYVLGTDYIQFFDNGLAAEGSVGIRRYTSGDVLVETISAGGCISGISTQGFLYVSTAGNFGTWISNGAAYPLGGSLTYTPTAPAGACANDAELNAFAASTSPVSNTPAPVPTLSEWAMILFGLILAGGAALYIQRRQMAV